MGKTEGLKLFATIFPFGIGYFLAFFLRNINAVIANDLVDQYGLDPTNLGLMTSLFFAAAVVALIPLASLLDRIGPRPVLMLQLAAASLGCLLFATALSPVGLMFARFLIGLGIAGCLMTGLKAVTAYVSPNRWCSYYSLVLAFGGFGVVIGTRPALWLADNFHWSALFWGACIVSVAGAVIVNFVPEDQTPRVTQDYSYSEILSSPLYWRLMPVMSLTMGGFFAVQSLWGGGWLRDVAGLDPSQCAERLFVMAVAMTVGLLVHGRVADQFHERGISRATILAGGLAALIAVQTILAIGIAEGEYWIWAVFGFFGMIGALGYPIFTRHFQEGIRGRAITTLVVANFAIAFLVLNLFGLLLDRFGLDQFGHSPEEAYRTALLGLVGIQMAAFAWFIASPLAWRGPAETKSPSAQAH